LVRENAYNKNLHLKIYHSYRDHQEKAESIEIIESSLNMLI